MTPARLDECLTVIRWTPETTLARAFGCDVSLIHAWLNDIEEIPVKAGAWIEVLAQAHEAAEAVKPRGLKGKRAGG